MTEPRCSVHATHHMSLLCKYCALRWPTSAAPQHHQICKRCHRHRHRHHRSNIHQRQSHLHQSDGVLRILWLLCLERLVGCYWQPSCSTMHGVNTLNVCAVSRHSKQNCQTQFQWVLAHWVLHLCRCMYKQPVVRVSLNMRGNGLEETSLALPL
jgi:hypothetical protein